MSKTKHPQPDSVKNFHKITNTEIKCIKGKFYLYSYIICNGKKKSGKILGRITENGFVISPKRLRENAAIIEEILSNLLIDKKTEKKTADEEKFTLVELVKASDVHYPSLVMDLHRAGLLEQYEQELEVFGKEDIEPSITEAEFKKIVEAE